MLSGLLVDNADPLTRRDQSLEFLDVASQGTAEKIATDYDGLVDFIASPFPCRFSKVDSSSANSTGQLTY